MILIWLTPPSTSIYVQNRLFKTAYLLDGLDNYVARLAGLLGWVDLLDWRSIISVRPICYHTLLLTVIDMRRQPLYFFAYSQKECDAPIVFGSRI